MEEEQEALQAATESRPSGADSEFGDEEPGALMQMVSEMQSSKLDAVTPLWAHISSRTVRQMSKVVQGRQSKVLQEEQDSVKGSVTKEERTTV